MVIDLQRPAVPGFRIPEPPRPRTPLFDGYANLSRSIDAPYYEDYVNKAAGPQPLGSVAGGPTLSQALDIVHPDPRKWTSIGPPRALTGAILGDLTQKPDTSTSKLGSFNLNLIDPFQSYVDATGPGIGMAPQSSFTGGMEEDNPLYSLLNWQSDLPIKLMERPLAFLTVAADRLSGRKSTVSDVENNAVYPFQNDPSYWDWLRSADDEALVQQARAVAGQYISPGRNQVLVDTLMSRFREDRKITSGLSSGQDQVDYTAKTRFTYDYIKAKTAGAAPWSPGDWARATAGAYDVASQLVNAIPFIGSGIASNVSPIDPQIEAAWAALPQEERSKYLSDAGFRSTILNLATALPLFGGIGILGAGLKASSIPTIAAMGRTWDTSLKMSQILMATGVGATTAAWAMESFAPRPIADFGRDVNLAAPLRHSVLGGALNQVGFFASGTFGAALAIKSTARISGAVGGWLDARLTGGRITGFVGSPEIPYFSYVYGGSKMTRLFEQAAGVEKTTNELGVKQSLLSYLVNGSARRVDDLHARILAGDTISPELASMTQAERLAWADNIQAATYDAQHVRVAQWADRLGRIRQQLGLLPSTDEAMAMHALQGGVRAGIDDASRAHIASYGPGYFGRSVAEIRGTVEARLKEAGYEPEMARLDRELGTRDNVATIEKWNQAARLAHQLGFVQKQAELLEVSKGSHEQALTIFTQRTLFAQDIKEAVPVLIGDDAAAARAMVHKLVTEKSRVGDAYALGEFKDSTKQIAIDSIDPVRLADHLQSILEQGGVPTRRNLVDPAEPTATMPLNAFHTKLHGEGAWDLGFRSKAIVDPHTRFAIELERAMSAEQIRAIEPDAFLVRDVQPGEVPVGYTEIVSGQTFRRKNWYELDPIYSSDGRYFVKDDGSLTMAPLVQQQPAASRPSLVEERPIEIGEEGWELLSDAQKTLARTPDGSSGAAFDPIPDPLDLAPTGRVLSGRNAGANWPVLRDGVTGNEYLFKARRDPEGLTDLSEARMLGGVVAGKLFRYLDLHVAEEIPFEWNGTKGTIQRLVDVAERVDVARLERHTPEVVNEVTKQHVVDWLTAQHDSNSDSLLIGNDGLVYGVDKGQAYKYVADPAAGELAALMNGREFWGYRYDAADVHLGEYIQGAVERGAKLDRSAVESTIQKIEDLPDDVYLATLRPLAEARVRDGRFEATVEEFYANALARKRGIRTAVNRGFEELGYAGLEKPGLPNFWRPGLRGLLDIGTPARVNERPVDTTATHVEVAEPAPPPSADHYKAGVVVAEPDGSLWLIHDSRAKGLSWAKGRVDAGESYQLAAIREAQEELGLSVRITSHLADLPNEQGNITRYYIAERVSGGPEHVGTPVEISRVALVPESDAIGLLHERGVPSTRDQAVLEAYSLHKAGSQAKVELEGLNTDGPEAVTTANPAADWGYISHVRLKNGSVWRSPWLDVGPAEAAQINLGNRGVVGRAFDDLFQGWRTHRLMESQKATLHYTLTRDYPGFTNEQVSLLFTKLLTLQRESKASIQAMAGIHESIPLVGHWAAKVRTAAEEVFGEGPYLARDGTMKLLDWNRLVVESFRTSTRLNLTAGLTSYLKSIPGLGGVILPISDLAYPIFRFGISPLFKAGEIVESAMLNAMRGVFLSGDPFIDALYWKAGAGNGLGVLLDDVSSDMMLSGLTMMSPTGSGQARTGSAPFFFERLDPKAHAQAVAGELQGQPLAPGRPPSNLADSLAGGRLEIPDLDRFPDHFSEEVVRSVGPLFRSDRMIDPSTGDRMIDAAGGERTKQQVASARDATLAKIQKKILSDPVLAEAYGQGFAYLQSLPPGTIEKLAANIPYVHTPSTRVGGTDRQIAFVEDAIAGGYPMFSGQLSTGAYRLTAVESKGGGTIIAGERVRHDISETTVSGPEQWVGFADAKYGGTAEPYDSSGGMLAILKPDKLKDSVTVDTDRIHYANDAAALREAMMTPRAVDAISRIKIQEAIVEWAAEYPTMTFLDFLTSRSNTYFGSISPFEMAYMNGIDFGDVAALMLPRDQIANWTNLTQTHKGHPVGDIPVVPYEASTAGGGAGHRKAMWANALERAGLTDLGLSHPDVALSGSEALASLPPWSISAINVLALVDPIESAARSRLGLKARIVHSDRDIMAQAVTRERALVQKIRADIEKARQTPINRFENDLDSAERSLARAEAELADVEALAREVDTFWAASPYDLPTVQAEAKAAGAEARDMEPQADAWHQARAALEARMQSLGILGTGSGLRQGEVQVIDVHTAEVVARRAYDPLPPAAPVKNQEVEAPYEAIRLQTLLEEYQRRIPPGYAAQSVNLLDQVGHSSLVAGVDSAELRSAIKARAEQKLGHSLPSDPVIRSYARGNAQWIQGRGGKAESGELIITITDSAGRPYGNLTLAELGDLWTTYGLPKVLGEQAAASGFNLASAGELQNSWGGASREHLLHGPGTTPEGRLYYYRNDFPKGTFEQTPLGHDYRDPNASVAFDVRMAYHFEPGGKSYVALTDGHAFVRTEAQVTKIGDASEVAYYQPGSTYPQWQYILRNHEATTYSVTNGREALAALRDTFERAKPTATDPAPTLVKLADLQIVKAFERLYARGEVPEWIIAIDRDGKAIDQFAVINDINGGTAVTDLLPPDPAATFAEIAATPESLTARILAEARARGGQARRAADAVWNPTPFKMRAQDRLTFKIIRDSFAPILKVESPRAAGVFQELKVPDAKWADFLVYDRYLLGRWKESGSRADWEELVQHAAKYTGKTDYMATRKGLDEIYTSAEFETMMDTWRLAVRAAEDESYGVHFFSPYRSTFERSVNHPLLGVYPASWAFKVAKEWYRFLYQNTTLGFRAGMVPAQIIKQIHTAQQQAWAQSNPQDLEQWYRNGPLTSSIFIFNLLLPGDWSSVPFPFSRTIRDVARGNINLFDLFSRNMTYMGVGRDIRLLSESSGEIGRALTGAPEPGGIFDLAHEGPRPRKTPTFAGAESIRGYYAYR